jgi:hypothetical protein
MIDPDLSLILSESHSENLDISKSSIKRQGKISDKKPDKETMTDVG